MSPVSLQEGTVTTKFTEFIWFSEFPQLSCTTSKVNQSRVKISVISASEISLPIFLTMFSCVRLITVGGFFVVMTDFLPSFTHVIKKCRSSA